MFWYIINESIWLGISDLANEGVWLNFSQEEVWIEDADNNINEGGGYSNVYTNWAPNEPNDSGGENPIDVSCGVMYSDGLWHDYDCGLNNSYLQKFIIDIMQFL